MSYNRKRRAGSYVTWAEEKRRYYLKEFIETAEQATHGYRGNHNKWKTFAIVLCPICKRKHYCKKRFRNHIYKQGLSVKCFDCNPMLDKKGKKCVSYYLSKEDEKGIRKWEEMQGCITRKMTEAERKKYLN